MPAFPKFDDFLEAKKGDKPPKTAKVSLDVPPQGKNAPPYHAPHAKNDGKPKLRVVEKPTNALGDEATPALKDPERNIPSGKKPDTGIMSVEEYIEARLKGDKAPKTAKGDEGDGKVRVRVAEKEKGKGFGDEASPRMDNPKHNHPLGEKPSHKCLTTESFLAETKKMSDTEFVSEMLLEGKKKDDDEEESEGALKMLRCIRTDNEFIPLSSEVAKYLAGILPENGRAGRTFVNELKRTPGAMEALMREMVGHTETYNEIINQMGMPEAKVARRLVGAMQDNHNNFMLELGLATLKNEAVGSPMDERDPEPKPAMPQAGTAGGGPEIGAGAAQPGAPELGGPEVGPTPGAALGGGPEAPMPTVEPPPGASEPAQKLAASLNREFSYDHTLKEMAKHKNMVDSMRTYLKD